MMENERHGYTSPHMPRVWTSTWYSHTCMPKFRYELYFVMCRGFSSTMYRCVISCTVSCVLAQRISSKCESSWDGQLADFVSDSLQTRLRTWAWLARCCELMCTCRSATPCRSATWVSARRNNACEIKVNVHCSRRYITLDCTVGTWGSARRNDACEIKVNVHPDITPA